MAQPTPPNSQPSHLPLIPRSALTNPSAAANLPTFSSQEKTSHLVTPLIMAQTSQPSTAMNSLVAAAAYEKATSAAAPIAQSSPPPDRASSPSPKPARKIIHLDFEEDFYQENIIPFFHSQLQHFEKIRQEKQQMLQKIENEQKELRHKISILEKQLEKGSKIEKRERNALSMVERSIKQINKHFPNHSESQPSKRARIEPSPNLSSTADFKNQLLAEFYHPKHDYKGTLYYGQEGSESFPVKIQELLGSNKFSVINSQTSETLVASYNHLLFCPIAGNIFLFKDKGSSHYYAVLVHKSNRLPHRGISCKITPVDSSGADPLLKYVQEFDDILPFGPDHPNAKLLRTDGKGTFYLEKSNDNSTEPL